MPTPSFIVVCPYCTERDLVVPSFAGKRLNCRSGCGNFFFAPKYPSDPKQESVGIPISDAEERLKPLSKALNIAILGTTPAPTIV